MFRLRAFKPTSVTLWKGIKMTVNQYRNTTLGGIFVAIWRCFLSTGPARVKAGVQPAPSGLGNRQSASAYLGLPYLQIVCFSLFATFATADELRYEAFWVEGEATSLHTAPLSLEAFLSSGQDLAENGFILVDAETGVRNGQRLFAGLWARGSGATIFEGPFGPIPLREAMDRRESEGLRLVDFEIFRRDNGGRLYMGVFRPGSGEQHITRPMEENVFLAAGESLTNRGLRLRDFEVEEIDGRLLYTGLFRAGAGLNVFTTPVSLGQFRASLPDRLAQGLELIDMECVGDSQQVIGVFRSGDSLAEITSPRSFGEHFMLAGQQFNDGQRTRDFEFLPVDTPEVDDNGGSVDPDNPPALPENPSHVSFTDSLTLRLQFTQIDDEPFTLELPLDALPEWLPQTEDGTPILPDDHCGLLLIEADSIFWQIPGDAQFTEDIFNAVPSVPALGDDLFLGGVQFAGPIGGCTGTQKDWVFPSPFTTEPPFEPIPNMSLVVQLRQGSEIAFIKDTGPTAKPIDVDKLFKDNSKKLLEEQIKFWNALEKQGENIDKYCPTVGKYWNVFCTQFPDNDLVCGKEVIELPGC